MKIDDRKMQIIDKYCENNEILKIALLSSINNDINIFNFSNGNEDTLPFISFHINEKSEEFINNLITDSLLLFNGNIKITFSSENSNYIVSLSTLQEYGDALFNLVSDVSLNNREFIQNNIVTCMIYLMYFVTSVNLKFKATITNDEIYIGILEKNAKYEPNEQCIKLSDCIENISNGKKMAKTVYKCDEISLLKLSNFFYKHDINQDDIREKIYKKLK